MSTSRWTSTLTTSTLNGNNTRSKSSSPRTFTGTRCPRILVNNVEPHILRARILRRKTSGFTCRRRASMTKLVDEGVVEEESHWLSTQLRSLVFHDLGEPRGGRSGDRRTCILPAERPWAGTVLGTNTTKWSCDCSRPQRMLLDRGQHGGERTCRNDGDMAGSHTTLPTSRHSLNQWGSSLPDHTD